MQFAYKCRHSTETALLRVKEDIVKALDCNKAVFLIMLDLSAAFDTIDHSILFSRLAADFGIKGTVLNWFKSYMTGRSFRVCVGGTKSETMSLKFGVPQGSIIGPKAFTMYSQPVAEIIRRHGVQYHIYADDTQLYVAFNPKTPMTLLVQLSNFHLVSWKSAAGCHLTNSNSMSPRLNFSLPPQNTILLHLRTLPFALALRKSIHHQQLRTLGSLLTLP